MKELSVQDWFDEIDRGLKYRREYGLEDSWAELEAIFYNVAESSANSGPNILLSTGDALLSTLTVPDPYLTVNPRWPSAVGKHRIVESNINMLRKELRVQSQVERATLHTFLYGRGLLKFGYDSEYGWDERLDIGMGEPMGVSLTQFDRRGHRLEYYTDPGMPWCMAVMPHDIVVPWGTFDLQDAPWIAHRVVRHVDACKADTKYSGKKNLKPCMSMQDFVKSYTAPLKPYRAGRVEQFTAQDSEDLDYVELWEIHDRRTKKIYVVATGHNSFLRNDRDLLQIDGRVPFVAMESFVPRSRAFWTTPDAFYLLHHQTELADIAIQTTKQRRLNVTQFGYDENAIDPEELEKALSGKVGAGIRIKGGHKLSDVFGPLNKSNNNQTLAMEGELVRRNARESAGFSRNQMGEYEATGRRTATEVQEVAQNSNLRMNRRQKSIRDLYVDWARMTNGIVFEMWKTPRVVQVMGQEGQQEWIQASGEQLKSKYSYDVGFSIHDPNDLNQRKQLALQAYMTLSQDPRIDPNALAMFLVQAFNSPQLSAIFKPEVLNGSGAQGSQAGLPSPSQGMGGGGEGDAGMGGASGPA